jgi:hypothetical protein
MNMAKMSMEELLKWALEARNATTPEGLAAVNAKFAPILEQMNEKVTLAIETNDKTKEKVLTVKIPGKKGKPIELTASQMDHVRDAVESNEWMKFRNELGKATPAVATAYA